MTAVDKLADANSKAQLVELAKEYDLPFAGKNKNELAEAIVRFEAGIPAPVDDEPEAELDPELVGDEVEVVEVQPAPQDVLAVATTEDEDILVKYTGQALKFQVGRHFFGVDNPFRVMPESEADELFAHRHGAQFRRATGKEAREFYS
jgi:hypothetical protein